MFLKKIMHLISLPHLALVTVHFMIILQCSAGPEVRVAGVAIIRTAVCISPALQHCMLELETNLREN